MTLDLHYSIPDINATDCSYYCAQYIIITLSQSTRNTCRNKYIHHGSISHLSGLISQGVALQWVKDVAEMIPDVYRKHLSMGGVFLVENQYILDNVVLSLPSTHQTTNTCMCTDVFERTNTY
jgi:hypothetical protein